MRYLFSPFPIFSSFSLSVFSFPSPVPSHSQTIASDSTLFFKVTFVSQATLGFTSPRSLPHLPPWSGLGRPCRFLNSHGPGCVSIKQPFLLRIHTLDAPNNPFPLRPHPLVKSTVKLCLISIRRQCQHRPATTKEASSDLRPTLASPPPSPTHLRHTHGRLVFDPKVEDLEITRHTRHPLPNPIPTAALLQGDRPNISPRKPRRPWFSWDSLAFFLPYSILSEQPLVDRLLSYRHFCFSLLFPFEGLSQLAGPEPRPSFFRPSSQGVVLFVWYFGLCVLLAPDRLRHVWYNQFSWIEGKAVFVIFETARKSIWEIFGILNH